MVVVTTPLLSSFQVGSKRFTALRVVSQTCAKNVSSWRLNNCLSFFFDHLSVSIHSSLFSLTFHPLPHPPISKPFPCSFALSPPMSRLTSARSMLLLLSDSDPAIQSFALRRLNAVVDEQWYEIPSHLRALEAIVDSVPAGTVCGTDDRSKRAALLASRVYFHLGQYQDSINFALRAGNFFTEMPRCEYCDTIFSRIIDLYVQKREAGEEVDSRATAIFNHVASTWTGTEGSAAALLSAREVVGFTLRARREDLLQSVLVNHVSLTKSSTLLSYALAAAKQHVRDIHFRIRILRIIVKIYADMGNESIHSDDYTNVIDCVLLLNDSPALATIIADLIRRDKQAAALQVAFDVADAAGHEFVSMMIECLVREFPLAEGSSSAPTGSSAAAVPATGDAAADASGSTSNATTDRVKDVIAVLRGDVSRQLFLKFLYSQCKADIHILNRIKRAVRPSVLHTATVMSAALMYAGTTIDGFYRDNLPWLGKAKDWCRFTTVASVGALHRGHSEEAMNVLQAYLPTQNNVGPMPFQESGSLMALGLIQAGNGIGRGSHEHVTYLMNALSTYHDNDIMLHGAALGFGLAAMASRKDEFTDLLMPHLMTAQAPGGEAVATSIGLIMMGSASVRLAGDLLNTAHERNQKEKVIRGIGMAIALIFLGKERMADETIASMSEDQDPWIRVGATWVLALAYAGTSDPNAIARLLEIAVRDVNDDVRRSAIQHLGFVTLKDIERCVSMTKTFSDSYNPHVRYGVTMALAIAGAGTANVKAVEILWTLKDDTCDFVRQGAFIALGMLLVQHTQASCSRVADFRAIIQSKTSDNKTDTATKFGCILAAGLIDAGGRNVTYALHRSGHVSAKAVTGAFLFSQYWYWFPNAIYLTLAMQPSCVILLNERLGMPSAKIQSNSAPSRFAVPVSVLEAKKESKAQGTKLAVLSTTQKEQAEKELRRRQSSTVLDTSAPHTPTTATAPQDEIPLHTATATTDAAAPATPVAPEPSFEQLSNPARVTVVQLATTQFIATATDADSGAPPSRYRPLRSRPSLGVNMLVDTTPQAPEDLVNVDLKDRTDIVKPPAPFDWP